MVKARSDVLRRNQGFKLITVLIQHKIEELLYFLIAIFNSNFEFKFHSFFNDQNGYMLILDIEIDEHRITFATIYGPNNDDPGFYESLKRKIVEIGNNDIIINGDFNLLLTPAIDGINYNIDNPNARITVLRMMSELNLYDVWREENLEKKVNTWKRKITNGVYQMGRLDFFLVSESLLDFCREENVVPGFRSDHSATSLSVISKRYVENMQMCMYTY